MRILIFRIIISCVLMLYSGIASAQHWEILRGVKDFYPDARSTSCFIYANNDSLFSYNLFSNQCYVYADYKYDYFDYRQELADCTADTVLLRVLLDDYSCEYITNGNNEDMWFSFKDKNLKMNNRIIVRKQGSKLSVYDKYFNPDSNRYERFGKCHTIAFDRNNTPYIVANIDVIDGVYGSYQSFARILKIANDSALRLVAKHSMYYSSAKISYSPHIKFDSKNNFWFNHYDSLFYYAADTVNMHFSCQRNSNDLPKDSLGVVQGGNFQFLHIDNNDELTAISNTYGVYSYSGNSWRLDTTIAAYIYSFEGQVDGETTTSFKKQRAYIDSSNVLWVLPFPGYTLWKRDLNRKWTYYITPPCYPSGRGTNGIVPIGEDKLQITENNFRRSLIFYKGDK